MAHGDHPLSVAARVDAACDSFEREWRAGRRPRVEDYVAAAPEPDRDTLRSALAAVEAELNAGRAAGDTSVVAGGARAEDGAAPTATVVRPPGQAGPPQRIGRFEVREVLGSGAFGRVYRAFDPTLDREVALKVPLEPLPAADRDPFLKEARAAATVSHPNVCQVYEVGEHGGQPYIVMALVPGRTLAEVLRGRPEPLPEREAAVIVHKLALALDAAHARGVVHRDLKPANVMFDPERNELVVMDFGLARRAGRGDTGDTQAGQVVGTPAYMSPEQARGDARGVGPATDVYSLGVVMYELLTGSRPFTGTVHEVIGRVILQDPEPPSARRPGVSPVLEAACLTALAKDPAARFASMRAFAEAVDGSLRAATDPTARLAWAVEPAAGDGGGDGPGTDTRKLAELFAAVTEQRKAERAELAAAVDAAAVRHRTPRWVFAALALLLAGGLAAVAAVVFLTRPDTVRVTIELKGIDLSDKTLRFALDARPVAAGELAGPVELTPGDHELVVSRDAVVVLRYTFVVVGGRSPRVEPRAVEQPAPVAPAGPKSQPAEDGFVAIFNGRDMTGWGLSTRPEAFGVDPDGNLVAKGDTPAGGMHWLLTEKVYTDYVLRLEFQFAHRPPGDADSGVAIRSGPDHHSGSRGARLEVQLANNPAGAPRTGAVVYTDTDALGPRTPVGPLAAGAWHVLEVEVRWPKVRVAVNGVAVNDADLATIDRGGVRNWVKVELDRPRGHIGLQSWRHPTRFRNIRVRELGGGPVPAAVEVTAIVSRFDADDDGWTVVGDAQGGRARPSHHKTGGNPGGHVSARDDAAGGVWYWAAAAKFLGDRSSSYGKTLSFDLTQSRTDDQFDAADVILEGGRTTLVYKLPRHPDATWTSYRVPLAAGNGWRVKATQQEATEEELRAGLQALTRLWIRGEYREGEDTGQLDNVSLER